MSTNGNKKNKFIQSNTTDRDDGGGRHDDDDINSFLVGDDVSMRNRTTTSTRTSKTTTLDVNVVVTTTRSIHDSFMVQNKNFMEVNDNGHDDSAIGGVGSRSSSTSQRTSSSEEVVYDELKRYWNRAVSSLLKLHSSSSSPSSSNPKQDHDNKDDQQQKQLLLPRKTNREQVHVVVSTSDDTTPYDAVRTTTAAAASATRRRRRWNGCDDVTDQWYDQLYKKHNETGRYYHTTIHLKEMLHYIDLLVPILFGGGSSSSSSSSEDTKNVEKMMKGEEEESDEDQRNTGCGGGSSSNMTSIDSISSILIMATFFHDAIYDPKSTTNEKDSATLFRQFCQEWIEASETTTNTSCTTSPTTAAAVQPQQASLSSSCSPLPPEPNLIISNVIQEVITTYILATEKHAVLPIEIPTSLNQLSYSCGDDEENRGTPTLSSNCITEEDLSMFMSYQDLFLDIDMSVLGKELSAYLAYANCIRKEYNFVPHDVYCEKRSEILQSFLSNNSGDNNDNCIYKTHVMRAALEDRARDNLQQEINLLKQKKIPS